MQEGSDAASLRAMAVKCRRLATAIHDPRAIDALRKLALEYEDRAADLAAGSSSTPFRRLDSG